MVRGSLGRRQSAFNSEVLNRLSLLEGIDSANTMDTDESTSGVTNKPAQAAASTSVGARKNGKPMDTTQGGLGWAGHGAPGVRQLPLGPQYQFRLRLRLHCLFNKVVSRGHKPAGSVGTGPCSAASASLTTLGTVRLASCCMQYLCQHTFYGIAFGGGCTSTG